MPYLEGSLLGIINSSDPPDVKAEKILKATATAAGILSAITGVASLLFPPLAGVSIALAMYSSTINLASDITDIINTNQDGTATAASNVMYSFSIVADVFGFLPGGEMAEGIGAGATAVKAVAAIDKTVTIASNIAAGIADSVDKGVWKNFPELDLSPYIDIDGLKDTITDFLTIPTSSTTIWLEPPTNDNKKDTPQTKIKDSQGKTDQSQMDLSSIDIPQPITIQSLIYTLKDLL